MMMMRGDETPLERSLDDHPSLARSLSLDPLSQSAITARAPREIIRLMQSRQHEPMLGDFGWSTS